MTAAVESTPTAAAGDAVRGERAGGALRVVKGWVVGWM